jgi:hypothetical protein
MRSAYNGAKPNAYNEINIAVIIHARNYKLDQRRNIDILSLHDNEIHITTERGESIQ